MNDRFKKCIFIFLLCFPFFLVAQAPKAILHLDKPFYVSGEIIQYQVYLPNSFKNQNKKLGVSLYQTSGNEIKRTYLKTEGKLATSGFFKIPFETPAKMHHIIVWALEKDAKKAIEIVKAKVPIYNDLENLENLKISDQSNLPKAIKETNAVEVKIQLSNDKFQSREEVTAEIQAKSLDGNSLKGFGSVSIIDQELVGMNLPTFWINHDLGNLDINQIEDRIFIKGRVKAEKSDSKKEITVFNQATNSISYTTISQDKTFWLPLPDFYDEQKIRFFGYQQDEIELLPIANFDIDSEELIYTEEIIEYLKKSKERKLIYQLYSKVEQPLNLYIPQEKQSNFAPDRKLKIADYETFPDIPTFFKEVVTPLKFKKSKGKYVIKMFNPELREFYVTSPLFIIDNQFTYDQSYVANLDIEKIEEVSIYYEPQKLQQQFRPIGIGGVVIINSVSKDLDVDGLSLENVFLVDGLLPERVEENDEANENANIPLFKSQIYWSSEIEIGRNGKAKLSFPHSDDWGTFKIEFLLFTEDGEIGKGEATYQVKRQSN